MYFHIVKAGLAEGDYLDTKCVTIPLAHLFIIFLVCHFPF